jgi:hypothetical protein
MYRYWHYALFAVTLIAVQQRRKMVARGSGSSIDADARNTEFFMAGLRDGFNGLTKNTPTDRSVADAYDIGFSAGQEDRRRGQGRPTDIPPPESRREWNKTGAGAAKLHP